MKKPGLRDVKNKLYLYTRTKEHYHSGLALSRPPRI
jgi:hypothetical protein